MKWGRRLTLGFSFIKSSDIVIVFFCKPSPQEGSSFHEIQLKIKLKLLEREIFKRIRLK